MPFTTQRTPRRLHQISAPDADDAAGSWTTAPLFSKINEDAPDDSSQISSETLVAPGTTSVAKISLGSLNDPSASTDHTLRVRAKVTLTLGTTETFTAELRQGSTLIATLTQSPLTTSYAFYEYTLSTAEADAITDYTALAVWMSGTFSAGNLGGVQVSWLEFDCPTISASSTSNVSDSETGSGADAASSVAFAGVGDTGSGTDTNSALAATVAGAETGTGTDAASSTAIAGPSDSGSGADAASSVGVSATETGSGTEAVAIAAAVAGAETGSGADAAVLAGFAAAETGTGTDAASGVAITDTETGSGADTGTLSTTLSSTETGSGADAAGSVGIADTDAGTGTDAGENVVTSSPVVDVSDTESGTGTDAVASLVATVVDSDHSGGGSDSAGVRILNNRTVYMTGPQLIAL